MNHADVCRRAATMLRGFEFSEDGHSGRWCSHCGSLWSDGHESDCGLADLIDELEAVEGTAAKVQRKEQETA
jgi:hypothetical protein